MTFLGDKEYNANVYPDEPVKKLWSLLNMNNKDYSLSTSKTPNVPLKRGSIGEIAKGEGLTLVISRNKSVSEMESRGNAKSRADEKASAKTSKEYISSVSDKKEATAENLPSQEPSLGKGSMKSPSDSVRVKKPSQDSKKSLAESQPSIESVGSASSRADEKASVKTRKDISSVSDKKEVKPEKLPSRETSLGGGSMKSPSNSIRVKKPSHDSKKSSTESKPSRGSVGSRSKLSTKRSSQSQPAVEKTELVTKENLGPSYKRGSFQSAFPPEITPQSRAKSLSKHLSGSSLHKTSFKGSAKKPDVIHETDAKRSDSLSSKVPVPRDLPSTEKIKSTEVVDEKSTVSAEHPSLPSENKRSNNSAEGISTFVLPSDSPLGSKISMKQSSRGQIGTASKGDIVEYPLERNQEYDASKSPEKPAEGKAKEPDVVEVTDSSAQNDIRRAVSDAPSGLPIATAEPLSLQGLKPAVFDQTVPQDKTSGEIETHGKRQDGMSTLPRSENDIHSGIKDLVSSAVTDTSGDNHETAADLGKNIPSTDSPQPDSPDKPTNGTAKSRRTSSEDKPVLKREDWHPHEQPPSISDDDLARSETLVEHNTSAEPNPPVELNTPDPKKSYDTSDSEQLFERHQHPEAASPEAGDQAVDRAKDSTLNVESANDKEQTKKAKKQDSKKKKGKSDKKKNAEEEEEEDKSAELHAAEAGDGMKSGSAVSVQSKGDPDDAQNTDELKAESNTSV